jgi:hypothetical protein
MHIPVIELNSFELTYIYAHICPIINMLISLQCVYWANPDYATLFSVCYFISNFHTKYNSIQIHSCCTLLEYLNFCGCFMTTIKRRNKYISRESSENNKENDSGLGTLVQKIWYVRYVSTLKNCDL